MFSKLILPIALLLTCKVYACPELEGVDLASNNPELIIKKGSKPVTLTRAGYERVPFASHDRYEECKEAFILSRIEVKSSGNVYVALTSNEDSCDGGNAVGLLFNKQVDQVIGEIGDSFISCL